MRTASTATRRLLDEFQRDFPLEPRPYEAIAERLGLTEDEVIATLERLRQSGAISRVGAVIEPNLVGASTLAAMRVPEARLDEVAALVSALPEVSHNYERAHVFNLWFVAAAPTRARLDAVLATIEAESGLEVLDLPLMEPFKLDLGFPLQWT